MGRRQVIPSSADRAAPRGDDTGCTILHVDMDAFFASVELLARPELVGTPVIVGGGDRGVVLSATYEARALGVHSAMPMSQARRLCPQAVLLTPHFERYSAASAEVRAIFHDVTPLVEPLSLDEAFLDVAGAVRLLGSPAAMGDHIRHRVRTEVGIVCSVGVATTKFVAKLATNHAKPDGLFVVPADGVIEFLHPLPVGALWGVGAKTQERLLRIGILTVSDLAHTPVATLQRLLGASAGSHLLDLAWGRDQRRVVADHAERSVGAERTFSTDIVSDADAHRQLLGLAELVARRMRKQEVVGRTVSIKVRTNDFATLTRSRTLREPTHLAHDIYAAACELFDGVSGAMWADRARIRLLGVRMEQLTDPAAQPRQLAFDEPDHGWREAESAIAEAGQRFGHGAIRPARLIDQGRAPSER